jgi:hypothetical protein
VAPTDRVRPAAYIRAAPGRDDLAWLRTAIAEGARQRGWPPPTVYADDGDLEHGRTPALARLEAAIEAGRHDALLVTDPGAVTGTASYLMGLLFRCTRNGVIVGFLLPPAPAEPQPVPAPPAVPEEATAPLSPAQTWDVLARARLEALSGLFPDWRIWLDQHGWHARRRQSPYFQVSNQGAPAYCVHGRTPTSLAAQLCWQQAADEHAPEGCSAR